MREVPHGMTLPVVVGREVLIDTEWLQVAAKTVRGMPGSTSDQDYYVVRPRDYVTVVAITPEQQIVLVRQYRPAVERVTLELPAGLVDPGEAPEYTVRRELEEETGYVAERIEHLGTLIPDTGRYENRLWCYVATNVRLATGQPVPEEGMEPILVDVRKLPELLRSSELDHALHLAALMLAVAAGHLPSMLAS
jgi:ADP-ribose pyrophosphatase